MVQPDRTTRGVRRPTPGAPSPRTSTSNNTTSAPSYSAPQQQVTQEQVSLSLVDIVEEMANHVPAEKQPQVELLRRLAREKPDQQTLVKQQMLLIGGAEAVRAAVTAVVSRAGSGGYVSSAAPAPASTPAPPAPAYAGRQEPPMPPNLPAIFGSTASTPAELAEFKAELLHAFHCGASACPVTKCANLATKLQRLREHVPTCSNASSGCLLCSIFTYLRDFHAPDADACAPCSNPLGASSGNFMYADELMQSKQLLPCWDREKGKLAWLSPPDALAQVRSLTGERTAGAPAAAKRARTDNLPISALGSYPGLRQGVLQTDAPAGLSSGLYGLGGAFHGASMPPAPMPRVPDANAPAPSASAPPLPLPDNLDFARMTSEMYGHVADPFATGNARRGTKRGGAHDFGGSRHPGPLSAISDMVHGGGHSGHLFMPGVGMEASKSRSGLSNLNLGDMLRSTSLSELGFGQSFSDLGSLGLQMVKGDSRLKDVNASELSLSGLLGESAGDIVAGLGHERAGNASNYSSSHGGMSPALGGVSFSGSFKAGLGSGKNRELMDIMYDFGSPHGEVSSLARSSAGEGRHRGSCASVQ